ncbi:shikimate kinase [Halobacteriovorax sp. HFRX-2_2]|uniref:shikimate kinase n=1 Tax=unclassified Halobacteriovorax TaxID=2639665 RepID=UPI003722D390
MRIFLTGFSGAGKTTFGEKLSKDDQFQVFDLDEEIFNRMGTGYDSLAEYIQDIGIDEFRKDEIDMIKLLHQNMKDDYLISLGAGALDEQDVVDFISEIGGKLVYIQSTFEECWERLKKDGNRPLAKNGMDFMKDLYEKRVPRYEKSDLFLTQAQIQEINTVEELLKLL